MNTLIETILLYTIAAGSLAIVYGFFTGLNILNLSAGNAKMQAHFIPHSNLLELIINVIKKN